MDKKTVKKQIDDGKCKTNKEQRRRKFARFKDFLHHNLGPTVVSGFGDGEEIKCEVCGMRTYHAIYMDGKWRCVNCEIPKE